MYMIFYSWIYRLCAFIHIFLCICCVCLSINPDTATKYNTLIQLIGYKMATKIRLAPDLISWSSFLVWSSLVAWFRQCVILMWSN